MPESGPTPTPYMPEKQPQSPEMELARAVIEAVKTKGFGTPESNAAFVRWCESMEAHVENARDQQDMELTKALVLIQTENPDAINYAYDEILEPMRENGADFFAANPDLKAKFDSFYQN